MDDIITFVILMLIVFLSGLRLYCTKQSCSSETKQYYVYTVIIAVYVINLYYIMINYRHYNSTTIKIGGLLLFAPVILYSWMCQQNCNELFLPTFFIVFPCLMIIFNLYVYGSFDV